MNTIWIPIAILFCTIVGFVLGCALTDLKNKRERDIDKMLRRWDSEGMPDTRVV